MYLAGIRGEATHDEQGCGINVLNPMPTTSLSQLNPETNLSMEKLIATIMAKFETMWDVFVLHKGSFHPFMDLYLERWLHSYVNSCDLRGPC